MFDAPRNPVGRLDPCLYAPSPMLSRIRPALVAALVLGLAAQVVLADSIVKRRSDMNISGHAFEGHPDFSPTVFWPGFGSPDSDPQTGYYIGLGPLDVEIHDVIEPPGRVLEGTARQKFEPVFDEVTGRLLSLSGQGYAEVRVQRFEAGGSAGRGAWSNFEIIFQIAQSTRYDVTLTSSGDAPLVLDRAIPDASADWGYRFEEFLDPTAPWGDAPVLFEPGHYHIYARASVTHDPVETFVGTLHATRNWAFELRRSLDVDLDLDDDAFRFINPGGGSFNQSTNWEGVNDPDLQQVPVKNDTRTDTAVFDLAAAYSVDVGTQRTERLRIVNGNVTFTNADYTVAATSPDVPGVVIDNARLNLTEGAITAVHTLIGQQAASRLDVTGSQSLYQNDVRLRVGGEGEGRLMVSDQATVFSGESLIAAGSAPSDATVSTGADWVTGNLAVGFAGPGKLAVESGGKVKADEVVLGNDFGSRGEVRVHGVQGDERSLCEADQVRVGFIGDGKFAIEAGGHLRTTTMSINGNFLEDAGVLVTGRQNGFPSLLEVTDTLRVGAHRAGALEVVAGGDVVAGTLVIGHVPGTPVITPFDLGEVSVFGSGGVPRTTLTTTDLLVGSHSRGKLFVADGGLATTHDVARIGHAVSEGEDPGESSKATVGFLGSAGVLSEWRIGNLLYVGANGVLELLPGGAVTIGQIEPADRKARIGPGGELSGVGIIHAAEGVESVGGVDNFAGTVSPGASPGMLTIEGNYEQGAAGTLEIEFAGREAGQFDQLVVTGNAVLGGTLVLRFIDGFAPTGGDEFDFLAVAGTVEGQFQEVRVEGLQPGFQHELVLLDGTYRLVALNDGVWLDPDANPPPTCGPGLCGAGAAPMLLFTLAGLLLLRLHSSGRRASKTASRTTLPIAGLIVLLWAPTRAEAQVGTTAGGAALHGNTVYVLDRDPGPGSLDLRIGNGSSQSSVNRSETSVVQKEGEEPEEVTFKYEAKVTGSMSGTGATLSINAKGSHDRGFPDVDNTRALGDVFMIMPTGQVLPAGHGRAALSLTLTLNGTLDGPTVVNGVSFQLAATMRPPPNEADIQFDSFQGVYTLPEFYVNQFPSESRVSEGMSLFQFSQNSAVPQVNAPFTMTNEPFGFAASEDREIVIVAFLQASSGSRQPILGGDATPGEISVTASIGGISVQILEHTPPEGPPEEVTSFRWVGPSAAAPGGDFATASNWRGVNDPSLQQVPVKTDTRADTAIFDLNSTYNVNVASAATERLIVVAGDLTLNLGSYTVAATSLTEPSVAVGNQATLTLVNGALNSIHAVVGNVPPSGGGPAEVHLLNPNAVWHNQGRLTIGGDGLGRLFVANQADLASGESRIGRGAKGEVIIGNLALWDAANLAVGFNNEGSLTIESGGFVSADQVRLGEFAGAHGEIQVDGVHASGVRSRLEANSIDVGFQGVGILEIESGGHVRTQNMMIASQFVGAGGGAAVSGHLNGLPSALEVTDSLRLGASESAGQLFIDQGGFVSASMLVVGHQREGFVNVLGGNDGPRTTLAATTGIFVGDSSEGSLTIESGGLATASVAFIGGDPEATGLVRVLDPAGPVDRLSEWRIADSLRIFSNGTLMVGTGGAVTIGQIEPMQLMVRIGPGGTLSGNGTILASEGVEEAGGVDNFAGTVNPGTSPGTLTIEGNYEQGAEGTLLIELAGRGEGQFDQLVVSGNATLGGTLVLRFIDGFAPAAGDEFGFLALGGTVDGQFQEVQIEGLQPGFQHELVLAEGTYTLVAHSDGVPHDPDANPPPPCGLGLCGAGAAPMLLFTMVGLCLLRLHSPGRRASKANTPAA